ncbi:MAG: 3-phosphoshikimate 1-carboxyvinyltransferase [Acidobacteriota bacterium]
MTDFLALPPAAELRGTLRVPSSKSATNRALVAAALTGSRVEIAAPLESEDTRALRACLAAMGATFEDSAEGVWVCGPLRGDPGREIVLDVRDSGTAARFLTAAAAATPGRFLLTGSPRLCERPMGELIAALASGGVRTAYRGKDGCLPIAVEGGRLQSGPLVVDATRSSQFLSALLLAGVAVEGGLAVRSSGPVASAPYVRMTIETLRELGHEVHEGELLRVTRGRRITERLEIGGDYSSAIPFLAAVGAAGGRVVLTGLRWPSVDADAGVLPVLQEMGVGIAASAAGIVAEAERHALRPILVRATDFPDAVPALAGLAALADGGSRFTGIAHLRLKESDRIAALAALLTAAGASAAAEADALTVTGPARRGGAFARLPTFQDHRIAMAAAILALRMPGMLIENPECVSKSYPRFFRDLQSLARRPAHASSRQ